MSNLTVYTMRFSPPCRAVDMCAEALGLKMERKTVDFMQSEHLKPEFLKMNPNHTIPVLDGDGTIVYESHAIMIYLVSKYGKDDNLYPKDLLKQSRVIAAMHYESGALFARIRNISDSILWRGGYEVSTEKTDYIQKAYQVLEDTLVDDYVVGNSMTIADFSCIASIASICYLIPMPEDKYPRIHAWMERMKALPYYEEANGAGAAIVTKMVQDAIKRNTPKV